MMLGTVALPFLVFDLTRSLPLAGLAVFVEATTRVIASLLLAPWAGQLGPRRAYPLVESLRIAAFLGVAALQYAQPSWGYFAALGCIVVIACATAVINVIAEALAAEITCANARLAGFTQMRLADQLAAVVSLPVAAGLALWSQLPAIVGGLAAAASAAAALVALQRQWPLHIATARSSLKEVATTTFTLCHVPVLRFLIPLNILWSAIPAVYFASLPGFFAEKRADVSWFEHIDLTAPPFISSYQTVQALVGLLAVWGVHRIARQWGAGAGLGVTVSLLLAGASTVELPTGALTSALALLVLCMGYFGFMVLLRLLRQTYVPANMRWRATGALLALDALCYVVAAGCLGFVGHHLWVPLGLFFSGALFGMLAWRDHYRLSLA